MRMVPTWLPLDAFRGWTQRLLDAIDEYPVPTDKSICFARSCPIHTISALLHCDIAAVLSGLVLGRSDHVRAQMSFWMRWGVSLVSRRSLL